MLRVQPQPFQVNGQTCFRFEDDSIKCLTEDDLGAKVIPMLVTDAPGEQSTI